LKNYEFLKTVSWTGDQSVADWRRSDLGTTVLSDKGWWVSIGKEDAGDGDSVAEKEGHDG